MKSEYMTCFENAQVYIICLDPVMFLTARLAHKMGKFVDNLRRER
jgi:hypothetical protein